MSADRYDLVLGVAGHIDHGKTSLVQALTGIDTDRLPEEKSRGITIELGFAHCTLPSGRRVSVVDMPGHERFVRAMISGSGGVDLLLLVVAANEGVMPQTREHLAIATLMDVQRAVVALTKRDLANDEILELATEEVRELLVGTQFANAPIVPVSAHTRAGLDDLLRAIDQQAKPPRDANGPALLPIDRVFVRKGFGAVVTGTLLSGTVSEGDALVVAPVGVAEEPREVRIRGLQIHGQAVPTAHAGTRLAVNLAGLEANEIPRGAWLFRAGEVALSRAFDAHITLLPGTRKSLAQRSRLEIAVGATHSEATVSLLEGTGVEPGQTALARVTTEHPLALRPGERFVLRGPPSLAAVGSTVGGGVVVRPVAERARKRDIALSRARAVAAHETEPSERARVEAEAVGVKGLTAAELFSRAGFKIGESTPESAGLLGVSQDRFVSLALVDAVAQKVLQTLSAHHGSEPASRGLERRALKPLGDDVLIDAVLTRLVAQKKIARDGEIVFRAGWKPRDPDAVPYLRDVAAALTKSGITAPRPDEIAPGLKTDARGLEPALKRLVEKGAAVKINAEYYVDSAALAALEKKLIEWLESKGTIDAQGYKELTGASRKWVIPLAEYFDAKKLTIRIGDTRKLRGK